MIEIHIGDFIITKDGDVGKVIHYTKNEVITDNGVFSPSEIDGAKPKLLDIVHDGDFVNGSKVTKRGNFHQVNGTILKEEKILQFMTKKKFFKECYSPVIREDDEWKVIKSLPMYEVSRKGVIRNTLTGKYVSPRKNVSKVTVRLEIGGGRNRLTYNVAELVLEAFVEPSDGRQVIYKDGNVSNVNLENLEWGEKPQVKEKKEKPIPKKLQVQVEEKKQVIKEKPIKEDKLDDLSDEDFFMDLEKMKKERFMKEMMKRLNDE